MSWLTYSGLGIDAGGLCQHYPLHKLDATYSDCHRRSVPDIPYPCFDGGHFPPAGGIIRVVYSGEHSKVSGRFQWHRTND